MVFFKNKNRDLNLVLSNKPQNKIRVCFSNRGLGKIVKDINSLDNKTPDKVSIVNLAKVFDDMKFQKNEMFGFPSNEDFFGIDYVGYLIEKERFDKKRGQWRRIDEYRIIGTEANNFKDSRVAYGNIYRYRIKSIAKVTVAETKINHENFELFENIKRQERDRIKEELKIVEDILSEVERITNVGLKNKLSKGKQSTIFELIEGLRIVADENKTEFTKDSFRDNVLKARQLRRLKNLKIKNEDIATGTISVSALQKEINDNFRRIKEQVFGYVSYYFESEPSKGWHYVNVVDNIPPPPPSSIKIMPNTAKKEIYLTWLKPPNSQQDIKFYKIYRRNKVGEAWSQLALLQEIENIYVDKNIQIGKKYIYAITCVDVHGLESVLSIQIQCELNSNFLTEKIEKNIKFISAHGVRPDEVTVVLKKFQDEEQPIVVKKNLRIKPTKDFAEIEKKLLIRVTSLDNHEKKEFIVTLKNVNIKNN